MARKTAWDKRLETTTPSAAALVIRFPCPSKRVLNSKLKGIKLCCERVNNASCRKYNTSAENGLDTESIAQGQGTALFSEGNILATQVFGYRVGKTAYFLGLTALPITKHWKQMHWKVACAENWIPSQFPTPKD